ncbi:MAG: GGDEF domain-containing protein, partial [bacterium]
MTTQLEIHRELYEKLVDLLQQNKSNDVNRLQDILKSLEKEYHNSIYSHLVYILSHLFFKEKEAKEHWKNILHIRDEMIKKLGYEIDFRVAMLSYFIDIKKDIESPMIIEIMLFKKTQEEAYIDQLTGLYNYRYFMNQLVEEFKKAKRYEMTLSLVMFDIDNFKIYNDFYGHLKGNLVLHQISRILVDSIR